jgi:transcriptional regulator NrdR family protein
VFLKRTWKRCSNRFAGYESVQLLNLGASRNGGTRLVFLNNSLENGRHSTQELRK